jgi:hypothetical protein
MPIAAILALVIEYGPSAIALVEELVAELKPLFSDGGQPTPEQIADVRTRFEAAHARLQATK